MTNGTITTCVAALTACTVIAGCGGSEQREVIQNKGSDTLVNVAQAWAEEYQTVNPGVVVAVSGGGSGTGIAALINGTVDIANASRARSARGWASKNNRNCLIAFSFSEWMARSH